MPELQAAAQAVGDDGIGGRRPDLFDQRRAHTDRVVIKLFFVAQTAAHAAAIHDAAHRLDRGTSGVLLFGLNRETAGALGRQFAAGTVEKRYWAVVRGHPPASGTIDHPLSRQRDAYLFRGEQSSAEAQPALTHYRKLAEIELPVAVDRYPTSRYALLELEPLTGRRHQLRRHLKHLAHPIIGDATYGKGRHNRFFAEHFGCRRLLLACTALAFNHPVNGERVHAKAPVSGEFAATLARFGGLQLDQ